MLKLDEPFTLVIENEITDITESLSGQELHLVIRVVGANKTSRVSLDFSGSIPFAPTDIASFCPSPAQWSPLEVGRPQNSGHFLRREPSVRSAA